MPVTYDPGMFEAMKRRISSIFDEMKPDLELIGKLAAEAIVRTTLAGIGEKDEAFAPYSQAYAQLIAAVGGKPRQVVDLRGLFYHKGQNRVKFRSEARRQQMRADRQAYVSVRFALARKAQRQTREYRKAGGLKLAALLHSAVNPQRGIVRYSKFKSIQRATGARANPPKGIALFTARTGVTRPARGINDPLSEMSIDLIKVIAENQLLRIIYTARKTPYMITHNRGEGKMPKRTWFTLEKAAVKATIIKGFEIIIKARLLRAQLDSVPPPGPVSPVAEGIMRQALDLPGQ